ncbi:MAG: B12-binding domain-containing radical SAM protein [Spirochaetales bacterium]|nr:B12-binding domain-containing radical SAM protein [Spirochaetales bacterium]
MKKVLLIHPPVSIPVEPPAGIALLAGALNSRGIAVSVLDLNIEMFQFIANQPVKPVNTREKQADVRKEKLIRSIKDGTAFRNITKYKNAVTQIDIALAAASRQWGKTVTLSNYTDPELSPLKSADLKMALTSFKKDSFFNLYKKSLLDRVAEFNPDAAGISINYLHQALNACSIMGALRQFFPRVKIILGGGLITSWVHRPGWKNPFENYADQLVAGPGEQPLLKFCGLEENNRDFYTPDFEPFPLNDYLSPGFTLPFSASTGCFWSRCRFCSESIEGKQYRQMPPERVHSDIRELITRFRPLAIHFLDNALSPLLLKYFTRHPPGIMWYGYARFTRELTDPHFCRALKKSGCAMLQLGLESGDPFVLEKMHKGNNLEHVSSALKNLKQAGIKTYVYLLFGTPWENGERARRTKEYVSANASNIDFLHVSVFSLPAQSEEAGELETFPFYEGDLPLYLDFRHPLGWGRKKVRRFIDNEFGKEPAIAAILKKTVPFFDAHHAPFL